MRRGVVLDGSPLGDALEVALFGVRHLGGGEEARHGDAVFPHVAEGIRGSDNAVVDGDEDDRSLGLDSVGDRKTLGLGGRRCDNSHEEAHEEDGYGMSLHLAIITRGGLRRENLRRARALPGPFLNESMISQLPCMT